MFNKNLLIDTQSFIWFVENDPKLPVSVRDVMEGNQNNLFISIASLWEIVIKSSLGKLSVQKNIPEMINNVTQSGFSILQIVPQHLATLHSLEYIHRDPFDRIIISQAITENMPVVSSDKLFSKYQINVIKANA
jgi:PIN domain nuclease of toxin-antitoxin system